MDSATALFKAQLVAMTVKIWELPTTIEIPANVNAQIAIIVLTPSVPGLITPHAVVNALNLDYVGLVNTSIGKRVIVLALKSAVLRDMSKIRTLVAVRKSVRKNNVFGAINGVIKNVLVSLYVGT